MFFFNIDNLSRNLPLLLLLPLSSSLNVLFETLVTFSLNIKRSVISMWYERWFLSSNAKDIGVLYLMFALFSGLVGTAFSVLIRLELSGPGVQFIADNQLYNSIITAHAIIMIFFMVEIYLILNSKIITLKKRVNENLLIKFTCKI